MQDTSVWNAAQAEYIPYARALIAYAAWPTLEFEVYPYFNEDSDSDSDAWHLFNIVVFALHRKSQFCVVIKSGLASRFPFMSLLATLYW